jgi:flagellar biogenesis protein FliO
MASTVPNRQRPPIFLGKKKSADESHRFAGESDRPWYGTGIGALAIVLGLIVVLFLVLRRWTPSLRTGGSGVVQIVGRTVLAPRQSLVLVQLGRRLVLIGVSAERIQPVCEITDNEEAAAILAESRRIRGDFSSWLDREAAEFAREGAQDGAGGETVSGRSKPLGHLLQKLRSSKV